MRAGMSNPGAVMQITQDAQLIRARRRDHIDVASYRRRPTGRREFSQKPSASSFAQRWRDGGRPVRVSCRNADDTEVIPPVRAQFPRLFHPGLRLFALVLREIIEGSDSFTRGT